MDGILIVDKPKGYTSHDIVNILRKELKTKKIGHTGTLDPNATGVLPILIGQATKISKYLIEHNKTYIAELTLGKRTSTGDIEGEVIEESKISNLSKEDVILVLKSFLGKQKQKPPIYSSIKINGMKAYEYARKGLEIEIPEREIEILGISLLSFENNTIIFQTKCSKGTYIRTLCEDIAKKIGTVGFMSNLRRIQVDEFTIKNSFTIEQIKENKICITTIEDAFIKNDSIKLDDKKTEHFLNGVKISINKPDNVYRVYNKNIFLGLGIVHNNLLKRDVIVVDN